ncbi:MAG: sugar phosphate isomerase/epimerase [Oscillospiraceae bacterium]|nr:sugar phosphate isomerase/epimerase [Oscillospiraceae bacterium]
MGEIKYSYMDHWFMQSPQGLTKPNVRRSYMEFYLKQIAALGFKGLDIFGFNVMTYAHMFGSFEKFNEYLREIGMEKVTSIFQCYIGDNKSMLPHVPECHDRIFNQLEGMCRSVEGNGVESFIMMPAASYCYTEPVTDEKIKILADLWNRVGQMTLEKYGMKLVQHHEFWSGLRELEWIRKFYEYTDPRYVFFFCDTAQHVIAGIDPAALYDELHDRIGGFHLKDTRNTDFTYYRIAPDTELMVPDVPRWFFEAGSGQGLVDFPAVYEMIKKHDYSGWISVEHDKAEIGGGNFSESTAVSAWYINNVLNKIL